MLELIVCGTRVSSAACLEPNRFAACTPYTSLWGRRHRRTQLVDDALCLMDAQGIERPPNAVPMLRSMAANMHSGWWGLRLFAYALSWLYRYWQ